MASHLSPHPGGFALEEQVEVAGETYHIKGITRTYGDYRQPITSKGSTLDDLTCMLIPEPWNEHDPNAVAVMIGMHHVGYLPAELASDYTAPLRAFAASGLAITGFARIWAKDDNGMIRARVTVKIPAADRL